MQPPAEALHSSSPAKRWAWLPTSGGAVHRDTVTSFDVERTDGDFKGGSRSMWLVRVFVAYAEEPTTLRLQFFDASELCDWVDKVFSGAAFTLIPPAVVTESPDWVEPEAPPQGARALFYGGSIKDAIREVGDGLAGGDSYTPPQGYRPPPGASPIAI